MKDPAVTSGPDMRVPVRSSRDAIPFTLRVVAGWSWRILGVLLLAAAVVALIARLKVMFVALFVALLITALLQPALARLVRLRCLGLWRSRWCSWSGLPR